MNLTLDSIYYPVEPLEHDRMVDCVADEVIDWPNNNSFIIGQDSNAKVGVRVPTEVDELPDKHLGLFGMPELNKKADVYLISSNQMIG